MVRVREENSMQAKSITQITNKDAIYFIQQNRTFDFCEYDLLNNIQSYSVSVTSSLIHPFLKLAKLNRRIIEAKIQTKVQS